MGNGPRKSWIGWAGPTVVLAALTVGALVRANAPAGRFTVNAGGTVTDNKTHLTWQQSVTENLVWDIAKTSCTGAWRVPNIRELQSIVDEARLAPAIDPTAFPNTPLDHFWSASPDVTTSFDYRWTVDFGIGYAQVLQASYPASVRCVR